MTKVFEPVALIRDLAPPEGRVTVELLDERGLKVLQREKQDNAILNHWNECVKTSVRQTYAPHVAGTDSFLGSNTDLNSVAQTAGGPGQWWTRGIQDGGPVWGLYQFMFYHARNIVLTDSSTTVNADEWMFPGNLNAFCYTPEGYAPSSNTQRSQLTIASSFRTKTTLRYVAEWGTGYGNGVHQSVGIGGVTWPAAQAMAYQHASLYPTLSTGSTYSSAASVLATTTNGDIWHMGTNANLSALTLFNCLETSATASDVPNHSGHRVSDTEWWLIVSGVAGNHLTRVNPTVATTPPFGGFTASNGLAVTGPTMTTIGSTAARTGVCVVGTDLWLAYGTTLKRCVKPTNTTLTVSNTYAPAGVGTCVDITTDGTDIYWLDSTKVWVISATTGAVTSSWAHGLTGTMQNLAYGTTPSRLYVSYMATSLAAAQWNTAGATARTPLLCAMFTTPGVSDGTFAHPPHIYASTGVNQYVSGLVMPLDAACKHWAGWNGYSPSVGLSLTQILGPSHISRTVLGSPVTKTSANSMRVIYEFGF